MMGGYGIGDLAQNQTMRRQMASLQSALARHGQEATTGLTSDLSATVRGDHRVVAGIERSLTLLASYRTATAEAGVLAQTMQGALATLRSQVETLGSGALASAGSLSGTMVETTAVDAKSRFDAMISVLNTEAAGRPVFAGAAGAGRATATADDILAALSVAISGQTTPAGVEAAISGWFDDPAGYAVLGYTGSPTPLAPFDLGEGEETRLTVTAAHPTVKEALKAVALAALAPAALPGDTEGQVTLLTRAGEDMLGAVDRLAALQASVGSAEARISAAATRQSSEKTALERALSDIVSVDYYEAASRLQAAEQQMETFYTVAARLSQLSLTDYL